MNKKTYAAPVVTKVELKIQNAILAVCHSSATTMDPRTGSAPCSVAINCFNPGG